MSAGTKAGIIGLASVGKSSLFQLLTGSAPLAAGGRPEPRLGVAEVPDPRLDKLAELFAPRKKTPATVEYADVPGVSKGQGSHLVDLPALRGVDVLVHVVRAFESDLVPHPEASVDPLRDAQMLELELILADLGLIERRLERLDNAIKKTRNPDDIKERDLFQKLRETLETERPLRAVELEEGDRIRLRNYSFLSAKPLLLAVNLGEENVRDAQAYLERCGLTAWAEQPAVKLCPLSASIESEMGELSAEDARAFREDLGLAEPGLNRVIRTSYTLLGLISFLTAGEDECRAWTIRRGTPAQKAASVIHSDIERGFIRAEVVAYEELVAAGSIAACRDKGVLRLEGKQYEVQDGDVINFRFNV
jgi:hypothetical protein